MEIMVKRYNTSDRKEFGLDPFWGVVGEFDGELPPERIGWDDWDDHFVVELPEGWGIAENKYGEILVQGPSGALCDMAGTETTLTICEGRGVELKYRAGEDGKTRRI